MADNSQCLPCQCQRYQGRGSRGVSFLLQVDLSMNVRPGLRRKSGLKSPRPGLMLEQAHKSPVSTLDERGRKLFELLRALGAGIFIRGDER
ncbi:hypothetical protein RRG08_012808 [Elysia crispata]|uniref:Uncharacterized protein n=1 Tax=Elysia crispata TaxID=231223 RepID=A0AAE0XY80_9GAST|nr:hypothetical protein RRG08_012808 [Elysia crispata]